MIRRPPRSTRTDTLFPYTTLFRSILAIAAEIERGIEPRRLPRGIEIPAEAQHPDRAVGPQGGALRSEEHTSELQSLMRISYAVFCLKKKTNHPTRKRTAPHYNHQVSHHIPTCYFSKNM